MNVCLEIGFRFLPPDEQIINYFLWNKMNGRDDLTRHIREVDLLKQAPWNLPALSIVQSKYPEWLFFYKLNKISEGKNGRATQEGFWKSTGQDREIRYGGRVIGTKKTLVFHKGRTPRGVKTDWVMHEYHATVDYIPPKAENSYVVGYLRNKAAENPENSSNYGQPNTHFAESSRNNAAAVESMEVAPQLQSNSMDYEVALQTQLEDQGIFDYDLSPLDLPSSSALAGNNQNQLEEEGISMEDLLLYNDLVDDEQNEWQLHSGTIEQEQVFWTNMFPNQNEYRRPSDYRTPSYAQGDQVRMSDGTGNGRSEGFNRMESGFHHDEILIMDSSVDSARVTSYDSNCLELVQAEKSVNSRTCKSQYEPRSHKSVVQVHPKRVQLQRKSSGIVVSRDKTRESGVRGPVVEHVRNKKSIMQSNQYSKMDPGKNGKSDLISRSNRAVGSGRKTTSNFPEMSELSCEPNQPLVYIVNVLIGVFLLYLWFGYLCLFIR